MSAVITTHDPVQFVDQERRLRTVPTRKNREWAWVALMLFSFLAINIATADRYPFPFLDEVMYTDPAINYVTGHGFTVGLMDANSPVFYFYNGPAHSALLIPWLKVFGVSMRSVRSINFLYMAIIGLLIWSAVKRASIVASSRLRLLLLSMILCNYAVIFSCRCGRYDCLGMLAVALAFWTFTLRSAPLRLGALTLLGAASPWVGLQLLPFEGVLGGALLVFTLFRYWREISVFFVGVAAGGLGLIEFFKSHGVWQLFLHFINYQSTKVGFVSGLVQGQFRHSNTLPKDFSFVFVLAAAFLLAVTFVARRSFRLRSPLVYGLAVVCLLAITLIVLGKFPTYYGWMTFVPLAICVCASLGSGLSIRMRRCAVALCVLSSIVGVGLHVLASARDWKDRDYSKVEQFVNANVRADDRAYVEPQAYYPAKTRAAATFFWTPVTPMSAAEKSSITVCIINPDRASALKEFGAAWYRTKELVPGHAGLFGVDYKWGFLSLPNYHLAIYRRVPAQNDLSNPS